MEHNIWTRLATCYPLGFLPRAPGTWGSLLGVPLALLTHFFLASEAFSYLIAPLWLVVLWLAYVSIRETEKLWGIHDDSRIVIDEVLGQGIALVFVAPTIKAYIIGFLLFRVFDIWKPGPVGWADANLDGPWGTILDDVFAGCLSGLLVWFGASLGYY
mgnify:CR=1 FL=1